VTVPAAGPAGRALGTPVLVVLSGGHAALAERLSALGEAAVLARGQLLARELLARVAEPADGTPRSRPSPGPVPAQVPTVPAVAAVAAAGGPSGLPPGAPEGPVGEERGEVWDLVERAQGGDVEAFGELYDRYVDTVYRYLLFRVGSQALAEDLTSETFLRALRRIGSVSWQGRDLGAWLVTIARNLAADHFKSGRYRLEVATADMRDADRAEDGPEGAVLDAITHETLLAAVRELGAEQQECIVLRFLQNMSVAETAAAMGKNEGAIKALQYRAVRSLGRLLPEGFVP